MHEDNGKLDSNMLTWRLFYPQDTNPSVCAFLGFTPLPLKLRGHTAWSSTTTCTAFISKLWPSSWYPEVTTVCRQTM